ncbi:MAG TPA: TadE/TadG family type IV pilus assembly protein [Candidatus Anammoximicrobium sp.]|nr:TadE/TadG family type IV pilus assembly protein [Candidatus Anammoximicrobium sp.]
MFSNSMKLDTRNTPGVVRTGRRTRRRRRIGAAMVEMAFTLPLFLVVVLGIIEFGQAFMVQQVVTNAAREGARHGVLPNATTAEAMAKAREHLAAAQLDVPSVTVTITPTDLSTARTGTIVTVRVSAPYQAIGWMATPWFLGGTSMTGQCVMRHE